MRLSSAERRVVSSITAGQDRLIELATALIGFDTSARDGAAPARDERALQELLATRLGAAGAEVDLWEPRAADVIHHRQVPDELDFAGFPQLLARFPGTGSGRSLLLNGHVDAVSPEPRGAWSSDPFQAEVRGGLLYGRGACDMKGGVAAMVFAAEALAACSVELQGDLLISTVTDEESTSAGGVAAVVRGVRADAGIVAEPTGLGIAIACRGSLLPTVTIAGQAGHAAAIQPHWQRGGAVSATEKASYVLDAIIRLRETWRDLPSHQHRYLPPGRVVATTIAGGQWVVSHADSCRISGHISYLPSQADAEGFGTRVESEFTEWIHRHTCADPWLAAHPPEVSWSVDVPPAEVSPSEPIVATLHAAAEDLGVRSGVFGADFWHDGATLTRAGIPSIVFGPGRVTVAHTVDEHVPVDELVMATAAYAVTAMRFCGVG